MKYKLRDNYFFGFKDSSWVIDAVTKKGRGTGWGSYEQMQGPTVGEK